MPEYRRRMEDDLLSELLGKLPAVLHTGPRTFQLADSITAALALDGDFRVYRYGPQRRRAFAVRP